MKRSGKIYYFPIIQQTPLQRLSTRSNKVIGIFLSLLRTENQHLRWNLFVSNGSNGLDRNNFLPPLQHEWNFSKCLRNRKYTFPVESIHVQWITHS